MANEFRAVLDTNVVVSAMLLPRSVPRQAFDFASIHGRLLVSEATMTELDETLRRPKFDKYLLGPQRMEFLAALLHDAEVVDVKDVITDCRDQKDNKFLELAVSGKANYLVSGDADLLVLNPFRGVAILTPQAFLANIQIPGE